MIEMISIFKGRDVITYEIKDYRKHGDNATPYRIQQNPSDREPFVKFNGGESDGVMVHMEYTAKDIQKLITNKENK